MKIGHNLLYRLIAWRITSISERRFIIVLSFVVGLLSGLAALLLKKLIHSVGSVLVDWLPVDAPGYVLLAYPMVGIILTVIFVRFVVKDDIGHGISKILFSISRKSSNLRPHNSYSSMVASSLTIGLGGSVGAEAPIVLTGASIGSNLARLFRLNYQYVTLMIGCGAAGAIAGIFKAPIAGIVFTLEVLMLDLTMVYLVPLLISAMTAAFLSYFFMGSSVLLHFTQVHPFTVNNIVYYILLGILAGLVSLYFTWMNIYIEKLFGKIKRQWVRIVAGGAILGLLIFLFPSLWGEGYPGIVKIFNGNGSDLLNNSVFYSLKGNNYFLLLVLAGILVFKVFAMSATTGGGGVGGIFAPTLFMGAVTGFFMSRMINTFYGVGLPEDNFALAGMAGMMAAVMHAPLTGVFLIAEITGGYNMIMPLIITSTIAYITIINFEPHSIYTKRLAERGELITHHKDKAVLQLMDLKHLIETNFEVLPPEATLRDLVKAISRSSRNLFPVVDSNGILKGMVKLDDIKTIIFEQGLYDKVKIKDLMYMPEHFISPYDSMEQVAEKFESSGRFNLAVIENGKYLGFISRAKVFSKYRKTLQDVSHE